MSGDIRDQRRSHQGAVSCQHLEAPKALGFWQGVERDRDGLGMLDALESGLGCLDEAHSARSVACDG
jgi:hypothetical protein